MLIDVTRGEIPLRRWWRDHGLREPLPVYASGPTCRVVESRHARLEHCTLTPVRAGERLRLTRRLERFTAGASALVIDGAMWRRRLFSHLTIDQALPDACRWQMDSILLTQIGRTAPRHEDPSRAVAALCPTARPAHDGMRVAL